MKTALCSRWLNLKQTNLWMGFALVLLSAVVAGCSGGKPEKVVILGSNTIGEELAPQLVAEYKKEHPSVAFELEFKGTTYGMGALIVGRCDVAAASRDARTNEVELARDRGVAFNDHVIGSYDVAVIVKASNPITNLTREQVRDLFTGAVQNWKDVGGPDAPVHLYSRHPISGTHLGFRELAMENKPYALHLKTYTNYMGLVQAVAQDENGIGYSTIVLANSPGVKPVSIGGVVPTIASVNKGQYPYARTLRLYTDKANETPSARSFVEFVQSARGQAIMAQMGFAPRP
jgi:phosphate transport system substrate-binding protein